MAQTKTVEQLPRGRHGLTRDEVLTSQRARMLDAICQAVAEKGYAGTAVNVKASLGRHPRYALVI